MIFGIISKKSDVFDTNVLVNGMDLLTKKPSRVYNIWHKKNIGFGSYLLRNTIESQLEVLPYHDKVNDCVITSDSRIDYRMELATKLGVDWNEINELSDSQIVLKAYYKWGENCVNYLYGDFAFAIWDNKNKSLFCARDHFGCRPLYYIDLKQYFAFSSNPRGFLTFPNLILRISSRYLFDSICSIFPNKTVSGYKGVEKLSPGYSLQVNKHNQITKVKYWELRKIANYSNLDFDNAILRLRKLFFESVKERSRSCFQLGIELSGGLDSSSIAVMLKEVLSESNDNVCAFTHVLNDHSILQPYNFSDELKYAKLIVESCEGYKHFLIRAQEHLGCYNSIINTLSMDWRPLYLSYATLSDMLYCQAKEQGVRVLLSGFGGDEGVTYQAKEFSKKPKALTNNSGIVNNLSELRKFRKMNLPKMSLKKGLRMFAPQIYTKIKLWSILRTNRLQDRYQYFANHKSFISSIRMKGRFTNYYNRQIVTDIKKLRFRRIDHPHISMRLESSYLAAHEYNIEYRYPFLDVKLIEFVYSLNEEYLRNGQVGRYIFRMAMEGILPDIVRTRSDKTGATIPDMFYRIMSDEDKFLELLIESKKENKFHYIDYKKVYWMLDKFRNITTEMLEFNPRYFFNAISILVLQKWQREGKIDIGIKC